MELELGKNHEPHSLLSPDLLCTFGKLKSGEGLTPHPPAIENKVGWELGAVAKESHPCKLCFPLPWLLSP